MQPLSPNTDPTTVFFHDMFLLHTKYQMKMMLQSTDAIPMNFGFTGKGNTSKPEGLKEVSFDKS